MVIYVITAVVNSVICFYFLISSIRTRSDDPAGIETVIISTNKCTREQECKKSGFWNTVRLSACVFASAKQLDRFYSYSVFESLSIIGWCLVNMNFPAVKLGALQMDTKKHNWIFLENVLNGFDQILAIYGDHHLK
jgi:hypothetical protein